MSRNSYSGPRQKIRHFLTNGGLAPSSEPATIRASILADSYLTRYYKYVYLRARRLFSPVSGINLEIGSGVGLAKKWIRDLVSSDIKTNQFVEMQLDGSRTSFPPASLANVILVNSFHHLNDPARFLKNMETQLVPGGRVILYEPYWGFLATIIYSFFHPEPFSPFARRWNIPEGDTWDSNQAISWIIFRRDFQKLSLLVPSLSVVSISAMVGPSYLFSGGVYGQTRFPRKILLKLFALESGQGRWLDPLRLFVEIVIEKDSDAKKV